MSLVIVGSGANELGIEAGTGRIGLLRTPNKVFIQKPESLGPVRIHLPLPDFEAHLVDAHTSAPTLSRSADALALDWADLLGKRGRTGVSAQVEVQGGKDGAYLLRCRVCNRSPVTIPQVLFPWISGFRQVDGLDDQVTFGKFHLRPWRDWGKVNRDRLMDFMRAHSRPTYSMGPGNPYSTGMKWVDFGGSTGGVTLFSREKTSSAQYMHVSCESYSRPAETIELSWSHYPYIAPGEEWRSPEFVLYPHEGDWHQGVLKFREHASRTFSPLPSIPRRDETLGQQTLWMSWDYQDWQDVKYTFKDLPAIASEALKAGLREMTVARATALDFCLPPVIRAPLGTSEELKSAVEEARRIGVNIIPFYTCHLIREDTIGQERNPREWYAEDLAGQRRADCWNYDPHMMPPMPIHQLASRSAYYVCPGSREWRKAFFELVEQVSDEWACHGLVFDQSMERAFLCFNPLHGHKPGECTSLLGEVLAEARARFVQKFGDDAALSGEGQWDAATEWMDFTWDGLCMDDREYMAPFTMAFPRARQCMKCTDYLPQINRIFTAGYWLDLYLGDGGERLGAYPELTRYLASLAPFKKRFSRFFNQRDLYLHTLGARSLNGDRTWIRSHRSGAESLVLVTHPDGAGCQLDLELDLNALTGAKQARLVTYSRGLEVTGDATADSSARLTLTVPPLDFVAVHVSPANAAQS